jgi:hypothetical protein
VFQTMLENAAPPGVAAVEVAIATATAARAESTSASARRSFVDVRGGVVLGAMAAGGSFFSGWVSVVADGRAAGTAGACLSWPGEATAAPGARESAEWRICRASCMPNGQLTIGHASRMRADEPTGAEPPG